MRRLAALLLALAAAGAAVGAAAGPVRAQPAAGILLRATGEEGAGLRGRCTLIGPAGEETVEIDAPVPLERRFAAAGVSCDLRARGRVTLELLHAGSRSRTSTTGGRMTLALAAAPGR